MCKKKEELVTADEAAALLGTTNMKILMLIKRGMLKGQEKDGEWHLCKESVLGLKTRGWQQEEAESCRNGCSPSPSCNCGGSE